MTAPRTGRLLAVTAVGLVVLTSCGRGSAAGSAGGAVAQLRTDLQVLATATAAHRYPAAVSALGDLRADLAAAGADGTVSAAQIAEIRAAMVPVQQDLMVATAVATSPPTSAAVTARAAAGTASPASARTTSSHSSAHSSSTTASAPKAGPAPAPKPAAPAKPRKPPSKPHPPKPPHHH